MEQIQEGFDVFLHDGGKAFGAVRRIEGGSVVIYVENAGDFVVPRAAVKEVQDGKVVLDSARLEPDLRGAIARAHAGEDPRIP